jgi:hypothetical protein
MNRAGPAIFRIALRSVEHKHFRALNVYLPHSRPRMGCALHELVERYRGDEQPGVVPGQLVVEHHLKL